MSLNEVDEREGQEIVVRQIRWTHPQKLQVVFARGEGSRAGNAFERYRKNMIQFMVAAGAFAPLMLDQAKVIGNPTRAANFFGNFADQRTRQTLAEFDVAAR